MPTFEEAKVKLVFDKDSRKNTRWSTIISNIDLTSLYEYFICSYTK